MLCRGKGASFFFLFGASDERWIEDVEKNLIKPTQKSAKKEGVELINERMKRKRF
jgi:hypothetical protein